MVINNHQVEIETEFIETMVDGKFANALPSNKSTQRCYMCHATPKCMNNLKEVKAHLGLPDEATFSWGLSTLHVATNLWNMSFILLIG